MNNKRYSAVMIIVILLVAMFAGCNQSTDEIYIAMAGPLTGNAAQWGESMKNGVELAVEQWNAKGGILGKTIIVDYEDDQGDGAQAASVAQKIVSTGKYAGVIGHFTTSCSLAAAPTYQESGLPDIQVASTNPGSTSAGEYIFRINPTNTAQGSGVVKWALEQGKSKIAIFYVNNDYGAGMYEIAKSEIASSGGTLVYDAAIPAEGQDDFSVLLENVVNKGAEALILLNYYADNAKIVIQAKNAGMDLLLVSSDGAYSDDFISIAGEAAEGVHVATWFHPDSDNPLTIEFLDAYEERYGKISDTWAPFAYDAANIMITSIEKAGDPADLEAIRNQIASTENFAGATGNTTFNDERVPDIGQKSLLMTVVQDGEFVLLK